jgi:hypothetical protein
MIGCNAKANYCHWENIVPNFFGLFIKTNSQNDGEWIHKNPLQPAKFAGFKPSNLGKIKASQSGNKTDNQGEPN